MRRVKEILRLHFEHKLGQRQIARSTNVSQSTVHEYLSRAQAAGLAWPLDAEWDEERLQTALFPPFRLRPNHPGVRCRTSPVCASNANSAAN